MIVDQLKEIVLTIPLIGFLFLVAMGAWNVIRFTIKMTIEIFKSIKGESND